MPKLVCKLETMDSACMSCYSAPAATMAHTSSSPTLVRVGQLMPKNAVAAFKLGLPKVGHHLSKSSALEKARSLSASSYLICICFE